MLQVTGCCTAPTMTLLALLLILAAALFHATWNLLAKRAGGGLAFTWLFGLLGVLLYAPLALTLILTLQPTFGWIELGFIAGSAIIHLGYFLFLQRGYLFGDLSLVYPLARGTGPMLATLGAIALFGERPSPVALSGAALVIASVFVMTGGSAAFWRSAREVKTAFGYGLLTGLFIAAYTLWDAFAVSELLIQPLIYMWLAETVRVVLITPFIAGRRDKIALHWRMHKLEVFGVAVLSPLSYILVLTAFVFTPVSYVAPAREISILIGALLGARLLAEGDVRRRLMAAAGMVLGIVALALG